MKSGVHSAPIVGFLLEVCATMPEELRCELERLTLELRSLNQRLQSVPSDHSGSLSEFREAVDTIRLTAWTAHELSRAREGGRDSPGVLVLTAAERARRCGQMATSLCADLDSGFLRHESARQELASGIEALRQRLIGVGPPGQA
jgi:hypothetical protein